MKRRVYQALRRHPAISIGLVAVAAVGLLLLSGQAIGWAKWELFAWRIDSASARAASGKVLVASWSFPYGNRAVTLRVPITSAEIDAARGVDTSAMFRASGSLRAHYMERVVQAQSRSPFIVALADEIRRVRLDRHLDDDEYLELMTRAIQSLRYGGDPSRTRLPVEVAVSGSGVCSEKVIMLGALMLHEGFKTGIWVFDFQNHVALAVGSDAAQFRHSGYAFIETTHDAFVGEYDSEYLAAGPRARPPQFIALGGTRQYHSGGEVEYILGVLDAARRHSQGDPLFVRAMSASRFPDRSIVLGLQEFAAHRLADYIRGQTDERRAVFEWLVQSTAAAAALSSPAFIY